MNCILGKLSTHDGVDCIGWNRANGIGWINIFQSQTNIMTILGILNYGILKEFANVVKNDIV